jgi:hypothetical protein
MNRLKLCLIGWTIVISIPAATKADETDAIIFVCQEASDRYSKFSFYWDQKFFNSISNFPAGSKERQSETQKIIDEVNSLIEREQDFWFKITQESIKRSSDSYGKNMLILANNLRNLTILNSFNLVGENVKNNNLGKSESFYKRRLFEDCIKK